MRLATAIWLFLVGIKNRVLQVIALYSPGARTFRVWLHRLRGVRIGKRTFIGTDVILETRDPHRISIGNNCSIGIRSVVIAHFRDKPLEGEFSVVIEDDVFIGPNCVILPNVTIGRGSVVDAGSVVTRPVPPQTMVRGNPAEAIKRCRVPMTRNIPLREFYANLVPLD